MSVVKHARLVVLVAATGVAGASGVAVAGSAVAQPEQVVPQVVVVADGLDNPRGVAIEGKSVLVAEAGTGGTGPCIPNPEGGEMCLGATGAVTAVTADGVQSRIVTGLPSLAGPEGTGALGLHDIAADWRGLFGVIGLGADPALRAELGPEGALLAHLVKLTDQGAVPLADLGAFEAEADPDGEPDTNPYGLLLEHDRALVADAGGNDIVEVTKDGVVSLVAVIPNVTDPVPAQAVPTTVVKGPDGALYAGQLTGFPFTPGSASVWRVVPGEAPTVYATGFTNIIDIEFDREGRLWVLEIAKNGLASGDLTGALIRVEPTGERVEVAEGALTAPGGLALAHDGSIYVSNNAMFPGIGQLLHIVP